MRMADAASDLIVIYTESRAVGGVTGVIDDTVHALAGKRRFVVIHQDRPALKTWAATLPSTTVSSSPSALSNQLDLLGWCEPAGIMGLIRHFHGAQIVHFHLHTPFSCSTALYLARRAGTRRIISTEHYVTQVKHMRRRTLPPPQAFLRELKIRLLMRMKRASLRRTDVTVTVSESNRHFLLATFGGSLQGEVLTIPNGIDIHKFDPGMARTYQNPDIPAREQASYVITTVAALNNQKGHEHLIRAVPKVLARYPDAAFLFVGDGHLRPYLQAIVEDLGLSRNIHFLGERHDVPAILAVSDLFVLPSLFEGMPLSVIEAMAAGRPVVATDVDGTAEVVQDGVTGILVPPKDSEALAAGILRVLADADMRRDFGIRARSRVETFYSRESMAGHYLSLYSGLQ